MPQQRQISAIMFTDIKGYTALMQSNEKHAVEIRSRHREIFDAITVKFNGEIIQYFGDGTLSIFKSSVEAIQCGIEMQIEFQKEPTIPVRIGIHVGDIIKTENDIIGDAVNIASRIENLGIPGSILISDKVHDQIKNQNYIKVKFLNDFDLKNVAQAVPVFAIANEGIMVPKLSDLRKKVRENSGQLVGSSKRNYWIATTLAILMIIALFYYFKNVTSPNINDKSIAVLAFADMSPDGNQEYFSDGISEEILNLLARVPDLKVVSRTSSFAYKGKEATVAEIGKALHVSHILEGSVRKSGNTVRITANLTNVSDDTQIWNETYVRQMDDIFKVQDEIAGEVIQQLKATLLNDIVSKTVNPKAYDLYLQAKQVYVQGSAEASKNAETLIRQSITVDSTYAPAWRYLSGIIYSQIYNYGILPMTQENITKGIEATKRAIKLDPNYADGYIGLASFERMNWNFTATYKNLDKALALAPENADVIGTAANISMKFGKLEKAVGLLLKAMELDPLNYRRQLNLGLCYWMLKDYGNSEKSFQTFLLHYPNSESAHSFMAMLYLRNGNKDEALKEIEKEPSSFWKLYRKCLVLYATGNKAESDALLDQLVADWGDLAWPNIASAYAFRGEKDEAFKWLDKAYENRDGSTLEILNYPEMQNLWDDPRWNAFINKLGLPKDHGFHRD